MSGRTLLLHRVQSIGLFGWTTSGYRCCHSTPAATLCRGYHPQAKRPPESLFSPQLFRCITYPFLNLLLAKRMKLGWASGSSSWDEGSHLYWTQDLGLRKATSISSPREFGDQPPWSDVRCDKQEGRLMRSGFGACPSTYYLWRLEIMGVMLGPYKRLIKLT